jgi:hypothetical protein
VADGEPGSRVPLATVDAIHADVIGEALADVEIDFRFVRPERKHEMPDLVTRAQLVIEVASKDESAARALLDQLTHEGEEAALAQWNTAASAPAPARPRGRSPLGAFLIALLIPVSGPRYAGSRRWTRISIVTHLVGAVFWGLFAYCLFQLKGFPDWLGPLFSIGKSEGALAEPTIVVLLGALPLARLIDVIVSPVLAHQHNRQIAEEVSHTARS